MRDLQKYNTHGSFRPHQEETINQILDIIEKGEKHNIVIEAPTGAGKSKIAYIVAQYLVDNKPNWKNFLMSSQNMLLDQYSNEFEDKMALIKGASHYECHVNKKSYEEGPCHATKTPKKKLPCYWDCAYIQAREQAKIHPLALSNFHFFLLDADFVHQFPSRDLAIFDEAHNIESIMMDYRSVNIGQRLLKRINEIITEINTNQSDFWSYCKKVQNKVDDPDEKIETFDVAKYASLIENFSLSEDMDSFKKKIYAVFLRLLNNIISTVEAVLRIKAKEMEAFTDDMSQVEYEMSQSGFGAARKIIAELEKVRCKFSNFMKDCEKTEWVVDVELDNNKKPVGIVVKPVKVDYLTNETLTKMAEFRIFMSATICGFDRYCKNIGLDPNDTVFIDIPSTFPAKNRPFHYRPLGKMNYQNMQSMLGPITEFIDGVMNVNKKKGLVHSISYKNAQYIKENSKFSDRILIHDSKTKNEVLQKFYKSKDKVLISPSCTEGLDLKGDLSTYQIFLKVPYLSLGDKQIKRRLEIDKSWYDYMAILSIVQGSGRSCRTPTDKCFTIMLDQNFERLYENSESMFPKDFRDCVMWPS